MNIFRLKNEEILTQSRLLNIFKFNSKFNGAGIGVGLGPPSHPLIHIYGML